MQDEIFLGILLGMMAVIAIFALVATFIMDYIEVVRQAEQAEVRQRSWEEILHEINLRDQLQMEAEIATIKAATEIDLKLEKKGTIVKFSPEGGFELYEQTEHS